LLNEVFLVVQVNEKMVSLNLAPCMAFIIVPDDFDHFLL